MSIITANGSKCLYVFVGQRPCMDAKELQLQLAGNINRYIVASPVTHKLERITTGALFVALSRVKKISGDEYNVPDFA